MSTRKEKLEKLNSKIEEKLDGQQFIPDGIIDYLTYEKHSPKLLWILKEANSTGEPDSYDLRKAIRDDLKQPYGMQSGWGNTFNSILYVTQGILEGTTWDDIPYAKDQPDSIDILKRIAYINVKKTGGGATASDNVLNTYYTKYKEELKEQIALLEPDIIIYGATYWLFKNDLQVPMKSYGTCAAGIKDGVKHLWTYHPGARQNQLQYFTDIMTACKSLVKENAAQ